MIADNLLMRNHNIVTMLLVYTKEEDVLLRNDENSGSRHSGPLPKRYVAV